MHLIDQIDYDFSEAEENSRSLMQRFGALEVAMRQNDLAFEVQAYLKNHPCAAVVNLGCGWITPAEPATTAAVKSTIWTSRMLSPCGSSCCRRGAGAKHPLRPERSRMV